MKHIIVQRDELCRFCGTVTRCASGEDQRTRLRMVLRKQMHVGQWFQLMPRRSMCQVTILIRTWSRFGLDEYVKYN